MQSKLKKGVLNLGPNAGLEMLDPLQYRAQRATLVHRPAFGWAYGNIPVRLDVLGLLSFGDILVASVSIHISFFYVDQSTGQRDIVDVRIRTHDGMHQARVSIHAHVRLHGEVPMVSLFRLVYLRVTLAALVLGRARRCIQCGVQHR